MQPECRTARDRDDPEDNDGAKLGLDAWLTARGAESGVLF
jgi:hypothetical protein